MALLDFSYPKTLKQSPIALILILSGAVTTAVGCRKDTSLLNSGSSEAGNSSTGTEGGSSGAENGGGGTNTTSGGSSGSTKDSSGGTNGDHGGTSGAGGTSGTGGAGATGGATSTLPSPIVEVSDVDITYSGQPTEMTLYTVGNRQFVGYWGAGKVMTIASRELGSKSWTRIPLSKVTISDDAHHSVVLSTDNDGNIHVSGKMHSSQLVYYRTTTPWDVSTLQSKVYMVMGVSDETSCTYPQFFRQDDGTLIYSYRAGSSGQGDTVFNAYNTETTSWSRLFGTKLIDGQGLQSAYIVGPIKGPDGYWHLVWTWRSTADASTNHDLSYARTKDFVTWESGTGKTFTLPITLATADIVDPVPEYGGMINNNTKVGFDADGKPVIAYHKNDKFGFTQLHNARVEGDAWVTHQTSDWSYAWDFGGGGTIEFQIVVDGVKKRSNGELKQAYYHKVLKNGWGGFSLDPTTLKGTELSVAPLPYPISLDTPVSTTEGMHVRWAEDSGKSPDADTYYMLRWETLDANGDQPRTTEPPATKLRVYAFKKSIMDQQQ
jgi:hypothetical protein